MMERGGLFQSGSRLIEDLQYIMHYSGDYRASLLSAGHSDCSKRTTSFPKNNHLHGSKGIAAILNESI